MNNNTAINRFYKAIVTGQMLTAKQISARFNVANPYDLVHRLRNEGVNIALTTKTNSKGKSNNFYGLSLRASTLRAA